MEIVYVTLLRTLPFSRWSKRAGWHWQRHVGSKTAATEFSSS